MVLDQRTHSKEIRAEEAGAPFPKCSPTTCHISPGLFVMVFFPGQPRCPTFACGVGHHFCGVEQWQLADTSTHVFDYLHMGMIRDPGSSPGPATNSVR